MRRPSISFRDRPRGLTLIELIVAAAIVAILAAIAMPSYQRAQTRTKTAAAKSGLRQIRTAMEVYRVDHNAYPEPRESRPADPLGVIASSAAAALTTPVAYLSEGSFDDPFGSIKVQDSLGRRDMFGAPAAAFNPAHSLLFFAYPKAASRLGRPAMNRDAYAITSVGPDQKDSFSVYAPFPAELPASAARYGVATAADSIYDPTNGVVSGGDIAVYGGDLPPVTN